ncbi:SIR2 family protein [Comamonas squillarum]|uniref:SIR2 family protein n=1 Tax=Comamonas squillarum TaxID=2977320 RepID=A0ABY6A1N1_9BURK|nr:SIR2 family protein [Comamonas sp. PR12]UXC18825.1 SIR2 family protein [Comamonas sp. PR12]
MLQPNDVINEFSKALVEGRGAVFVGAGISTPSGVPGWADLLRDIARKRLDIDLNPNDDLPLIAQHIVNSTNNRGPLIAHFRDVLQKTFPHNKYHAMLAKANIKCLWTTNYDTLLEDTFRTHYKVVVHASDESISRGGRDKDIEVIKMHGCIELSESNDLVATQEDYDDFFENRPATAHRLRQDLIDRQFLFLGYGYGDSNIRNIVVEARRLGKQALRQHYIVVRRIRDKDARPEEIAAKQARQNLWLRDLSRVGISACQIDEYTELEEILQRISLRSRGQTVFVTGSHERDDATKESHPRRLGELLAEKQGLVLLDGQSSGTGREVTSAYMETCLHKRIDILPRLRLFSNPYAANPSLSNDMTLLSVLREWRSPLLRSAQVVVVYDGRMGTEAEVKLAKDVGCRIIPVPESPDGLPTRLLEDPVISQPLEALDPDYARKAREGYVSPEDVVECLMKMLYS